MEPSEELKKWFSDMGMEAPDLESEKGHILTARGIIFSWVCAMLINSNIPFDVEAIFENVLELENLLADYGYVISDFSQFGDLIERGLNPKKEDTDE